MKDVLQWWINKIYKEGDCGYTLRSYVDQDIWLKKFAQKFPQNYIENNTDFNCSRSFDMCIYISPIFSSVTSEQFQKYLKEHGVIYGIKIEISAVSPYAIIQYEKRYYEPFPSNSLEYSYNPFLEEHYYLKEQIMSFLETENITVLDESAVAIEVSDIYLSQKRNHIQIYHCLFQDEY